MVDIVEEVLKARYYRDGETCWEDVCKRVSDYVGNTQKEKDTFYNMLLSMKFLPNSPTLMNAGTEIGQLSACFVLPVEDSMDGIFNAIKWAALIHKSGGGTGFNFSKLRYKGAKVGSTDGVASGPLSFMNVFNEATETVKQGGRRRGANMGILNYNHKDIWEFITSKKEEGKLSNFNLSVMVDDKFMKSVVENTNKENVKLFDTIIQGMWENGEPSFLFLDNINKNNPVKHLGEIDTTNPCGEQPLLPFESCNLGSIDLSKFVNDDKTLNLLELEKVIIDATIFLDNIIDKNKYILPQIENATKLTRKIGLGFMGFADMLIKMEISYNSEKAIHLAEIIMEKFETTSSKISEIRAETLGAYPAWFDRVEYAPKKRNALTTCIAPTGSLSTIAQCSSGIEPVFSFVLKRKNTVGREFFVVNKVFEDYFKKILSEEKYNELVQECYNNGSIQHIPWLSKKAKEIFVTSMDITGLQQVEIVAAAQKHCGAGISKTVNWSNNTPKEQIAYACIRAWTLGCKGFTNYRDGSRKDAVLTLNENKNNTNIRLINHHKPFVDENTGETRLLPRRPRVLPGVIEKWRSGCGKLLISMGELDGYPYEVIINSEGGGCEAMGKALGKMISLALRWNVPATDIVRTLKGVTCGVAIKNSKSEGKSCAAIVGKFLESCIPDDEYDTRKILGIEQENNINKLNKLTCPDCGSILAMEEGCRKCHNCGWSKC